MKRFSVFSHSSYCAELVSLFPLLDLILQKVALCSVSEGRLRGKLTAKRASLNRKKYWRFVFSRSGKVMQGTKADKFKRETRHRFLITSVLGHCKKFSVVIFLSPIVFTSGLKAFRKVMIFKMRYLAYCKGQWEANVQPGYTAGRSNN